MKNVLVTGGCGFIGSNLVDYLKKKKYFVINIDKLTYSANRLSSNIRNNRNYKLIKIDINNSKKITKIIQKFKPKVIFNLAAETHVDRSIDSPKKFIQTNIIGTYSILESLRLLKKKKNNQKLVHISTDEVYGDIKEKFRSVDVLMIDDIQFIAGKDSTQEEFFHTFNSLVGQQKQIIISGDRAPSDLDGIEERLRSRLSFGVVGEIHKASYEMRLSILLAKAEERKDIKIDSKVIEFLARKISSNVRELEGAFRRLIAHIELVHRPITIDTARQLLHDLLRINERRVTVEEIQKKVAEYFNIKFNDMVSVRRSRVVARPRQVAMYLSKTYTPKSLPEIGRLFGGRDHTTVMHAIKKVEELCQSDISFAEHIKTLKRAIGV